MPKKEKNFHIITEGASVVLIAPLLIYMALNQSNKTFRTILLLMATANIIVDGYLLTKYKDW